MEWLFSLFEKYLFYFKEKYPFYGINIDPDRTLRFVASDTGLNYLPMSNLWDAMY